MREEAGAHFQEPRQVRPEPSGPLQPCSGSSISAILAAEVFQEQFSSRTLPSPSQLLPGPPVPPSSFQLLPASPCTIKAEGEVSLPCPGWLVQLTNKHSGQAAHLAGPLVRKTMREELRTWEFLPPQPHGGPGPMETAPLGMNSPSLRCSIPLGSQGPLWGVLLQVVGNPRLPFCPLISHPTTPHHLLTWSGKNAPKSTQVSVSVERA
jgi:hypothetical protein